MSKRKKTIVGKKASRATPAPTIATREPTLKLDLACGQSPREGFEGVDIWSGAQHVVDLSRYPWPFEDNSVFELHCSHYVEHIPMEYVDEHGDPCRPGDPNAQDAWFRFFDECHRILAPDCWITVIVPNARSNRAFWDATHRRFHVAENFLYLSAEWRKLQKLDHYNVKCNFGVDVVPIIPIELNTLHQDVQNRRFTHEWNTVLDWQARLKALKPSAI